MIKPDMVLDCFGLLCPVPIIKTAQKIKRAGGWSSFRSDRNR
ncbi:MAG: hypothetical protein ABIH50_01895 [bacterium]